MNNICYMFNTKILQLILVCHADILCNRWPPGEVLIDKELSLVTRYYTYHHILKKTNCNNKPTYDKFTVQPVITWEYSIFYYYISMFCTDTCNKQPLWEVLHSVEICFITSFLSWVSSLWIRVPIHIEARTRWPPLWLTTLSNTHSSMKMF